MTLVKIALIVGVVCVVLGLVALALDLVNGFGFNLGGLATAGLGFVLIAVARRKKKAAGTGDG